MLRLVARLFLSLTILAVSAPVAHAQFIGTFRWGLTPFCNVVTLSVTLTGGTFTLDGFDDQCSATTRASVMGTAFPNPDGSIGIGMSIVAAPGAAPVHVDVALSLATIGGPWRDSAGNTGMFVFGPPAPAPGKPRPPTGGLISTVTPGAGLVGGGTTGAVSLAVAYGGTGSASTAARSDHTHGLPGVNTAVGDGALAAIMTAFNNTAVGASALGSNVTGFHNTAVGAFALGLTTASGGNTALGVASLDALTMGDSNTGIGANALPTLTSGAGNVALGSAAGFTLTSGSNNIFIGSAAGAAVENSTIRIGNSAEHAAAFVAGIIGQSVDGATDRPVLIDATGKLGTIASSARFKQDIQPITETSDALQRLEPVSFRYTADQHRGSALQYGLIAEQVADVMPDLVIRDAEGRPSTVKYHVLPTLLLVEIQRLERERAAQANEIQALRDELRALAHDRR